MEKISSLPHQILLLQSPILSSKIRVCSVKPTKTPSIFLEPIQRPMQKRWLPQPLGRNTPRGPTGATGATGARTVRVRISLRIAKRARSMQLFKTPKSERNPRMLAISERNLRMHASRMGANMLKHDQNWGNEWKSWPLGLRWDREKSLKWSAMKKELTKRVTAEIMKTDVIVDERRV